MIRYIICFYLILNCFLFANDIQNINYYAKYIDNSIELNNKNDIADYILGTENKAFTIGSISKSIFGSALVLFSQDSQNKYLFKDKDLEITIGELLYNRKKHLESIGELSIIQKDKLLFINKLLKFINVDILNTKVYKILNHTAIFADDFNQYLLYLLVQKGIEMLPKEKKEFVILNGIQFMSLMNTKNSKIDYKYSNMGFMYIIKIMSLMTDRENFYEEVRERILKPLHLEDRFMPAYLLNKEYFKDNFFEQNYFYYNGVRFLKINIYDIEYYEMDTLNGGLITDLDSLVIVTNEIAKMYFGFDNVLTNNQKKISELFFKYKTPHSSLGYEFYSLGSNIIMLDDSLTIKMRGDVFGKTTIMEFIINRLESHRNNSNQNYDYKMKDYEKTINIKLQIRYKNHFLKSLLFRDLMLNSAFDAFYEINKKDSKIFKNLLAKSIYDVYGYNYNSLDTIEQLANSNPKKLVKELHIGLNRNIIKLNMTTKEKYNLKIKSNIYFDELEKFLFNIN